MCKPRGLAKTERRGASTAVCSRASSGTSQGVSGTIVEGLTAPEALEAMAISEALSLAADLKLPGGCS